mgnify:FL=1|jgi:hypothetical protein
MPSAKYTLAQQSAMRDITKMAGLREDYVSELIATLLGKKVPVKRAKRGLNPYAYVAKMVSGALRDCEEVVPSETAPIVAKSLLTEEEYHEYDALISDLTDILTNRGSKSRNATRQSIVSAVWAAVKASKEGSAKMAKAAAVENARAEKAKAESEVEEEAEEAEEAEEEEE